MEKGNHPTDPTEKNKKNSSQSRSGLNDYFKYAGIGFQMLVVIGVFTWGGIKLDQRTSLEKPLFTALFSVIGVVIGIYTVLKDFIHKDDNS